MPNGRSAKVRPRKEAGASYVALIYYIIGDKQATSKICPLCSFEGIVPYTRDIVKITKVTDIKQSIIEGYI